MSHQLYLQKAFGNILSGFSSNFAAEYERLGGSLTQIPGPNMTIHVNQSAHFSFVQVRPFCSQVHTNLFFFVDFFAPSLQIILSATWR